MRKTPTEESNVSNLYCSCPRCLGITPNYTQRPRIPRIRKAKSSEVVHNSLESLDIDILETPNNAAQSKYPVEVLYQRNPTQSVIRNSFSERNLKQKLDAGFCGQRQSCHVSDRGRMPWSMANSYRNLREINVGNSQFSEGERQESYDSRVFPFQSTPSGNLKVIPQQVVFESKKVSVLVADPRHTKVNIKAELAKQQGLISEGIQENLGEPSIMESDESKNAKKNQILSAMALMGNDSRSAALHQMMQPGLATMGMAPPTSMKYKVGNSMPDENSRYVMPNDGNDDRDDARSAASDETPQPELNLVKLGFTSSSPIDWGQIKLPQKTNLYKHMHYRITNYVNPDCLVQIEDVQFNCHLLVLQCYSAYFNEKTSREVVKLPPENVSPKAFELIYEWMTYVHGDSYTILKRDNILEVFLAAQFLGIKELEEQCWAFVDCEALFTEDTAFLLYLDAKKVSNTAIMELMIPRIMKFFLTLVSSKDFLDLKLDEVCVLLSSNYITVHSEIEVFMSAVRWLWHDWKGRKDSLEQIMSCVRFGLIAPWQLVDIRRNPENPEFLEITSHPSVQQMIDNGLAYAIIKYWYGNQTGDYYHWIDLLGLTEPPARNWAGEEKNYVTYREFLHDLEQYRKEVFNEKERMRSKQSSKSKRTSEQSGLLTSPRDILQQPERRLSSRKTSVGSAKNRAGDPGLTDSMRNEIIKNFVENKPQKDRFVYHCSVPPPSSIWVANNVPFDMKEAAGAWIMPTKLETIDEADNCRPIKGPNCAGEPNNVASINLKNAKNKKLFYNDYVSNVSNSVKSASLTCTSNSTLEQESAAVFIQYHFRKYLEKIRTRARGKSSKKQDIVIDYRKGHKAEPGRPCAPALLKGLSLANFPRGNVIKDYLRDGSLFFPDRESIIVFGGIDPHSKYGDGRNTGRNIFRYHAENNQWDLVGELPLPRHQHAVAFFKGRIYLAGGADPRDDDGKGKSIVVGTVWSFEPISRSWFKESELNTPRKNFGLVVMNGRLLAIGGQDKSGKVLSSVERYDTVAGVWENVSPLKTGRTGAAVCRYRDSVWVAGGMAHSKKSSLISSVESYDAKRDEWIEQSSLRFARCFSCLCTMNDVLYIVGGAGRMLEKDKISSCNAIDVYNSKEKEWKLHLGMMTPRHGHAVAYLGTQILIIGGVTTALLKALTDVECFCAERKKWIRGLTGLPVPLSGHGAVTLPPASLM